MSRVCSLAVAVVVTWLSGCASPARTVERTGDAGVVAIPANTNAWPTYNRREAMALIQQHVGPSFEIVEEKEVAVGTRTQNNQQVNREPTANPSMPFQPGEKNTVNTTTTSTNVTEWRIAYRRVAAPAGAVQQTQFRPGAGAVQPAGGVVPSVMPPGAARPAGTPTSSRISSFDTGRDCKA